MSARRCSCGLALSLSRNARCASTARGPKAAAAHTRTHTHTTIMNKRGPASVSAVLYSSSPPFSCPRERCVRDRRRPCPSRGRRDQFYPAARGAREDHWQWRPGNEEDEQALRSRSGVVPSAVARNVAPFPEAYRVGMLVRVRILSGRGRRTRLERRACLGGCQRLSCLAKVREDKGRSV